MWRIVNRTPYAALGSWTRNHAGVHEWLVAIKGTFAITPNGLVEIADEQLKVSLEPVHRGAPGESSLLYDADIVGMKPTTDVVLNATAYAPNAKPAREFVVGVRVADNHKQLKVLGQRTWSGDHVDGKGPDPQPVAQLEITYEAAFGGYDCASPDVTKHKLDTRNPVGRGCVARPSALVGTPMPSFEYPSGARSKRGPAGFGALDAHWSPRRELQGTYDEAWRRSRMPLLPQDWSPRSWQSSPIDQQSATHLRGGELVELTNLTESGSLRFVLPKKYFALTSRFGARREEHRTRMITVIIEPDVPRVIVVWLSSLTCRVDVDYLDDTIIREKAFV